MIETYKKLFSFLDGKAKRAFFYFVPLLLVVAILEIVSIAAIIPLISAALDGSGTWAEALPWAPQIQEDMDKKSLLYLFSLIFIGLFILKNIFILAVAYFINRFTLNNQARFQQLMFRLYAHRTYTFHLRRNTAELIRDLSQGIGSAFEGLRLTMVLLMDILLAGAACLALLVVEPQITVIISLAMVAFGFLIYKVLSPLLQRWGAEAYEIEARVIRSVNQIFGAIKEIRVLNNQAYFCRGFAGETNAYAKAITFSVTANQAPRFLIEVFVIAGFLFALILLFELRGTLEGIFTTLGLFGMAALRLMPSINRILSGVNLVRLHTKLVESIYTDYQDGLNDLNAAESETGDPAMTFENNITFKDVSYNYDTDPQEKPVLSHVDFKIFKGQSIGVVGPSGAGKTTLIDIFLGLLRPVQGEILIDGVSTLSNPSDWQKRLGYVPQHIYLIDDTVRRNIAFGIDDADIDDNRLYTVIRMAHLETVVSELPLGLDTVLGEQGARLSGGQRQRIGIARALYRDPEVIVFDEATSALDSEAEHEISTAIQGLAQDKTLIIIAHRLSTVRLCDKLIFMDKGRITDMGTFEELMDRNAGFQRMVQLNDLSGEVPSPK
jgi:ATP-binding cassette subfamily C protein